MMVHDRASYVLECTCELFGKNVFVKANGA